MKGPEAGGLPSKEMPPETSTAPENSGNFGVEEETNEKNPGKIIEEKLLELYENGDAEWAYSVSEPFSEDPLTELFEENANIFFDKIIKITEDYRELEPDSVKIFLNNLYKIFFSHSESIDNRLSIADMLIVASRVNDIEELRGFVGQTIVGSFVYRISFAQEGVENNLIEKIKNLPAGICEEVICQLETCFSNALANGSWSEEGAFRIQKIINYFSNSTRPLTRIVAEVAIKRLAEEEENPSLGFITYINNTSGGRLDSRANTQTVEDKINSDLPLRYSAVVAAKDALVGLDTTGMARFGAINENIKNVLNTPDQEIKLLKRISSIENARVSEIKIDTLLNLLGAFKEKFEPEKDIAIFYSEIFEVSKKEMDRIIDENDDVTPLFTKNWDLVKNRILSKTKTQLSKIEDGLEIVNFDSFYQLGLKNKINPFDILSKDDILILTQCLRPEVRGQLEEELGISFSDISFKAEMALLRFLSAENDGTYKKLCSVLKKYPAEKITIVETFVDCAKDIELGKKIISIAENFDISMVTKIFNKYLELVSQLNSVENILKDSYSKEADESDIIKIKEGILKKGKNLLVHFSDMVESRKEISAEEIVEELNKVEAEATTFFLVFKTLKEEGDLPPLSEIKGLSFEQKSATELSLEEQETIKKLYTENYKNNPELLAVLIGKFEEKVINPETKFYVLKHNRKLRACIGFTPVENGGAEYAHSFNVEKTLRGISIGNVMMENAMNKEAENSVLEGDCAAFEKISSKYIESGFIGTSFYIYENNPSLNIVRDEKKNPEYWGKQMIGKEDELVQMISNDRLPEGVLAESVSEQKEFKMKPLSNGYILTRYFMDKSSKKWYAVFEKK